LGPLQFQGTEVPVGNFFIDILARDVDDRMVVVRLLVPELQRRGLFRKEYAGPTLRENLGLPIPLAADWHAARRRASE
jgi:hypothetical protein